MLDESIEYIVQLVSVTHQASSFSLTQCPVDLTYSRALGSVSSRSLPQLSIGNSENMK